MKVTLDNIALKVGCSKTTVSRVLTGQAEKYRISETTAAAVLKEARKSGYASGYVAQRMSRTKTNTIGLLIPSVANPFFADMASVVISEAYAKGYTTVVVDMMEDGSNQDEAVATVLSRQVDGMIVVPCSPNATVLEDIDKKMVPVVLVDRYYQDVPLSYVTTNNYQGGVMATSFLIENGHRNILCIQGMQSSMPNQMRVDGYRDTMLQAGLGEYISVVGDDFSTQNGFLETKLALGSENRPTAIFALSNTILLGSVKAIRETGLSIPEDISIISFDNNKYLDYMVPPIQRIGQPVEDMAKLASKILFDKMEKKLESRGSHLELSPNMIPGGSVARVSGK